MSSLITALKFSTLIIVLILNLIVFATLPNEDKKEIYDIYGDGSNYEPKCYLFSDGQLEYGVGIYEPERSQYAHLKMKNGIDDMALPASCDSSNASYDFTIQQRKYKKMKEALKIQQETQSIKIQNDGKNNG